MIPFTFRHPELIGSRRTPCDDGETTRFRTHRRTECDGYPCGPRSCECGNGDKPTTDRRSDGYPRNCP